MSDRVSLQDILLEYLAVVPEAAKIGRSVRVVSYEADGTTPRTIEHQHVDEEGTVWVTHRDLVTGEERFHHLPGDRSRR